MKMSEVNEIGTDELQAKVVELSQDLFNLRLQKSISQLKNTAKLNQVKKDRARVLTRISAAKAAS